MASICDEFVLFLNRFLRRLQDQLCDIEDYEDLHCFTTTWLYYMTGVRVSEGFALLWSDYDKENKRIFVHSTLEALKGGIYRIKDQTKTDAGVRFIDLDDETINVLER